MKELARRIEAVVEAGPTDISVSAELLEIILDLIANPSRSVTGTRAQVSKIADLYAARFGCDFDAMLDMAHRLEETTTSKKFARAVGFEIQRRSARFQKNTD